MEAFKPNEKCIILLGINYEVENEAGHHPGPVVPCNRLEIRPVISSLLDAGEELKKYRIV